MPNYYRISDPLDVRDLSEQMAAWQGSGNPKASEWSVQTAAPSENAVWTADATWVVPPAPTFTAEQIVSQYFSAYQIAALQRLEMTLLQANKPLGPQMTAAKTWLENVMLGWAMNPVPQPAAAFGEPSVTFETASAEAVANLASNPKT